LLDHHSNMLRPGCHGECGDAAGLTAGSLYRELPRLPSQRRFPFSGIDTIGVALVAAVGAWIVYDAWLTYGIAWPMLAVLLLCAVGYVAGRLGTKFVDRWFVPTVVAAIVAVLLFLYLNPSRFFDAAATIRSLRYDNSRAALLVQAAFAGVLVTADLRSKAELRSKKWSDRFRVLALSAALTMAALFAVAALGIRSTAGRVTTLLLIPALLVTFRREGRQTTIVLAFALWSGALLLSLVLAESFARGSDAQLVARAGQELGYGRVVLWSEGYELVRAHPLRGVGPDLFRVASRTAQSRPGVLEWVHNEFLQVAAETGLVGLGLVFALFGWLFVRLARTRTVPSAVAALAVAALGIHACVDYVFHSPILPALASAMAGSATGGPGAVRRRVRRQLQRAGKDHLPPPQRS
jgi:hypothetical protein